MTSMRIETDMVDGSFESLERPVHRRSRLPLAWLLVFFATLLGLVGLAALPSLNASARGVEPEPAQAAAIPASNPDVTAAIPNASRSWVEVNRPIPLFELAGSDFAKLPVVYAARRKPAGTGRQDMLRFGSFGGEGPYLDLSITRLDGTADAAPGLFVDMARLAASSNLAVVRSGLATTMPTRFGDVSAADLSVARGTTIAPCLGFRLVQGAADTGPVAILGFACGTDAKPMDRHTLACVIDRIDLISAGDDVALRDFFVAAEQRRGQECVSPHLLAAGSITTWLDDNAPTPPLKRLSGGAKRRR
ncbi:hypothetical protein LGH83_09750 [Lichenihabitans sp. PAMC28606]|uniref:hypothetical protein n=1 Tax=Lichenihabitans sp. PAMC28606 TaxID=2880932 RepID=UPI001D0ABB3F|nr:hypothetical protein [Lichenihabitans sp. PAMC28606]UDL96431.1 hypothetical protein LGH83_09750 [Lichenihabitans sp. PAMC28606]